MAERNVLYRIDINISPALAKLGQLNKEFEKVEKVGGASTKKVSDQGGAHVRQLGFAFERMGVRGVAAFGEVFASIGPIGLALAAIIIPTVALTKAFVSLVNTAVEGFKQIVAESVAVGRVFDTTRAQFSAIFEGQPEAAEAAFNRVRELSRELGFDATELARAFIPEVENLGQLEEIVKIATALSRIDPTQGVSGATIALREFLQEGNVTSLVRRFELSRTALNRIKEIVQDQGLQAGLEALQAELERTGRDVESLSATFEVSLGRVQEFLRDLAGVAGEPIVDELKESLGTLLDFIEENFDELRTVAFAFGTAVAGVLDEIGNIGERLLGDVDSEDLFALADAITEIGLALELVVQTAGGLIPSLNFKDSANDVNFFAEQILKLNAFLLVTKAAMAALGQAVANNFDLARRALVTLAGPLGILADIGFEKLEGPSGELAGDATAAERFNQVIAEGRAQMQEYVAAVEAGTAANRAYADSLNESADAGEALANAQLAIRQASEDIATNQEELASLDEKIAEKEQEIADKREDLVIDRQRAEFDLELKHSRELIDLAEEIGQAREDAARKNLEKIQDIYRKHYERLSDAALDLRRDEEDIARDFARDQEDIDREEAEKRLEIEIDFRRRLEEIRRRFEFDAQEAIRANDAIEFLRIQRRLEFELAEEQQARDENTEDAAQEAQNRREELERQRQQELEDARIANQRKLEDLHIALARELEAQRINYARELEELRINEARKREELARNQQREAEDFKRAWDRRHQDLQRALRRELEELRRFAFERRKILAEIQQAQQAILAANQAIDAIGSLSGLGGSSGGGTDFTNAPPNLRDGDGGSTTPAQPPVYNPPPPPNLRDYGGTVYPGRPYLSNVPELFIPNRIGTAIPLSKLMYSPPAQRAGAPQVVDNSRKQQIDVSLIDPSKMSAMEIGIARNVLLQLLDTLNQ